MSGKQRLQLRQEARRLLRLQRPRGSNGNQLFPRSLVGGIILGRHDVRTIVNAFGRSGLVLLGVIAFEGGRIIVVGLRRVVVHGDEKLVVLCSCLLGIRGLVARGILGLVILVHSSIGLVGIPLPFRRKVHIRRGRLCHGLLILRGFRLPGRRSVGRGLGLILIYNLGNRMVDCRVVRLDLWKVNQVGLAVVDSGGRVHVRGVLARRDVVPISCLRGFVSRCRNGIRRIVRCVRSGSTRNRRGLVATRVASVASAAAAPGASPESPGSSCFGSSITSYSSTMGYCSSYVT